MRRPTWLRSRPKGYDYWALGHVHAREVVAEAPRIVFPGNLQGRHANETGAKGCELVTVEAGRILAEFVPLDVVRWNQVTVALDGVERLEALGDAFRGALAPVLAAPPTGCTRCASRYAARPRCICWKRSSRARWRLQCRRGAGRERGQGLDRAGAAVLDDAAGSCAGG
ncbi:MAG: hypothetical protein IPI73_23545 [Betaproteobacteria bacterium]|nr:hypothetical protein [Betaproteobacteria bacterium]